MAYSKLDKLPAELLRKIAVGLPSSAALSLMSTCRYIYMICNDWTVWREVVAAQSTLGDSALAILSSLTKPDWKRYMVADALASKGTPMNQYDVERWLPHMMVLHRTFHLRIPASPSQRAHKTSGFHRLCSSCQRDRHASPAVRCHLQYYHRIRPRF